MNALYLLSDDDTAVNPWPHLLPLPSQHPPRTVSMADTPSPSTVSPSLPPTRARRRLHFMKCRFCRDSKQKVGRHDLHHSHVNLPNIRQCEPPERQWPEQKCQRCIDKRLACSEPARKGQEQGVVVTPLDRSEGGLSCPPSTPKSQRKLPYFP